MYLYLKGSTYRISKLLAGPEFHSLPFDYPYRLSEAMILTAMNAILTIAKRNL